MGPPCCHGAETLPSSPWVSVPVAKGQGGSVPASLRDVQPGSLLPSHSLWPLLKVLLAAEKSAVGRGLAQPAAGSTKPVCAAGGRRCHRSPPPQPGCRHCRRRGRRGKLLASLPSQCPHRAGALVPLPPDLNGPGL